VSLLVSRSGVVLFVDILNIGLALLNRACVIDIVNIEAQGFSEIIKILELKFG